MLPSHTVENYLKAIFLAQVALLPSEPLVPMGQLASALGVVPGTATTMVKALAGIGTRPLRALCGRPPDPGRRKARRARPETPPADRALPGAGDGDELDGGARRGRTPRARRVGPPDRTHRRDARPALGRSARRSDSRARRDASPSRSTTRCSPARSARPSIVRRVSDQDSEFLRFVERHELKPGQSRARRGTRRRRRQRAASRRRTGVHDRRARRVEGPRAGRAGRRGVHASPSCARQRCPLRRQRRRRPRPSRSRSSTTRSSSRKRSIRSRHLSEHLRARCSSTATGGSASRRNGRVVSQKHQLSYTVSALDNGDGSGFGDTQLNYRYQAMDGRARTPGILAARQPGPADGRRAATPRIRIAGPAGQPAVQQAD